MDSKEDIAYEKWKLKQRLLEIDQLLSLTLDRFSLRASLLNQDNTSLLSAQKHISDAYASIGYALGALNEV